MHEPNDGKITVSLIVGTVGRAQELERMLSSIASQSLKSVELIIVDQNPDDRVEKLIENWKPSLRCVHVRSPRGLSLIHISEPTRQAEISYAVFCLKKKKK